MANSANQQGDLIDVWLGTSSRRPSEGIYHCTLNTSNGKLSDPTLVAEISGPGFLAMHPSLSVLYAVGGVEGKPSVAAYAIDGRLNKASLKFLNAIEIGDGGAAHVSVDATGKTVLTAQYGGGSTGVFSLNGDGSLKARTQLVNHEGASNAVPGRQTKSHAHWTGFSPDNRFAFVPDLGLDKVVIYKVDAAASGIEPHSAGIIAPGGGPRHMKFHNNGKWIYVLHELDLSVTVFDYDADAGTMTAKQTIETVPKADLAKEKFKSCSEIRVHPSGEFVYAANRGHDTITAFKVDGDTGKLTFIEREFIRGATPRNFNIDPSGKWLLAAGQDSHTLASFEVNSDNGELTYNRSNVHAPSCICVLFGRE
ncbi:MAG: lactonase family protein [Fuerstiella sp.]|nr:lactonase family protein [Fuerstiella sp.]MCP4788522.1 lactonase family protein [Fuerstiella sp.]MCP4854082.1 lactonase family protein [Fuerstiella sp.]